MNLLVNDTLQLQNYIPELTTEKDFSSIKPHISHAENNVLKKLIGAKLLTALRNYDPDASGSSSASASGSAATDNQLAEARELAIAAVAYCFAFEFSKTGDVHFTSMGIQSIETNSHKGAYEYQKRDVMTQYASRFDMAVDNLLQYLDENNVSLWPEALRAEYKASFIQNAAEFSKHCNIFESRRTFIALKPLIADAHVLNIIPITGKALFDDLLSKVNTFKDPAAQLTEKQKIEKDLVTVIIPKAVANLVMADAIQTVSIKVFADGFTFSSFLGMNVKGYQEQLTEKDIRRKAHLDRAQVYLNTLRGILEASQALFESYTPLPVIDPTSTDIINSADRNHFFMS